MNKIELSGNVGQDAVFQYTPSGAAILKFSIADNFTDKGEKKSQWFNCIAFKDLAIDHEHQIKKGDRVSVQGTLRLRKWTGKDGIERTSIEILCNEILKNGKPVDKPALKDLTWAASKDTPKDTGSFLKEEDIPF